MWPIQESNYGISLKPSYVHHHDLQNQGQHCQSWLCCLGCVHDSKTGVDVVTNNKIFLEWGTFNGISRFICLYWRATLVWTVCQSACCARCKGWRAVHVGCDGHDRRAWKDGRGRNYHLVGKWCWTSPLQGHPRLRFSLLPSFRLLHRPHWSPGWSFHDK